MSTLAINYSDLSAGVVEILFEVLLSALPVVLLYSVVMLAVSMVIIIVMHRRRLYRREKKLWNILAKLHYVLWAFIFVGFGFALGMISAIQSYADKAIDERLQPALVAMVPLFQQKIIDGLPPELAEKPMTGQAIYDHVVGAAANDEALRQALDEAEGWFHQKGIEIQFMLRRHLTKIAIDSAIQRAGEKLGVDGKNVEFTMETIESIDFSEDAEALANKVSNAAKTQVAGVANGVRLNVLMYAGILLALLLIEPLVYYKLVLPRKKKALEAAAAGELPE